MFAEHFVKKGDLDWLGCVEWRAGRFVAQRESGSLRLRSALLTLHPARLYPFETVWASQKSPAIDSILSRIVEEATQASTANVRENDRRERGEHTKNHKVAA